MSLLCRRRPRSAITGIAAVLVLVAAVVSGCTSSHGFAALPSPAPTAAPASPSHPNIVFVLTDDLSSNLVPYMPHVRALAERGMSFSNYTVTDSLCCPSRASIFTGMFPHDTKIVSNVFPSGGFLRFRNRGEDASTFATSLFGAGYRTAFFGKYLNGYQPQSSQPTAAAEAAHGAWVGRGWSTWGAVGAGGYRAFDYAMADGHKVDHYGHKPRDYMTTVLDHKAVSFIDTSAKHRNPFMLEVATFSPHTPYVPAPADRGTFAGISPPQTPAYNRLPSPPPLWLRGREMLQPFEKANIQRWWQLRVEAVQSVDRMIGNLERTLQATGQARNTVFVFSSDNGYHLGEYGLEYGKQTAFDTDIKVPLIVTGPGIPAGVVNNKVVENIDLRPTFEQLAGAATPSSVEGHSLVPLLHGENPPWRTVALVEHTHPRHTPTDPDEQNKYAGNPPSYDAIRGAGWIYVRYAHGDPEYYDIAHDPYELHNLGPSLSAGRKAQLNRIVDGLVSCHGTASCWQAGISSGG